MAKSRFTFVVRILLPCAFLTVGLGAAESGALVGWGGVGWYKEQIGTLTNVTHVSCSSVHLGAALTAEGTVRVFGNNDFGQLYVPEGLSNVVDVAGGPGHVLALRADGSMVAWGHSLFGLATVPASAPTNVIDVAANNEANYALLADGSVYSWALGGVSTKAANGGAIAAGWSFWIVLNRNGTVSGWGLNDVGQIDVPADLTNVTKIAAGVSHSLALKADGTVVAWGGNEDGQCNVPAGLTDVVSIGAGTFHSVALKRDGTVVAWGSNESGQLDTPKGYDDLSDIFTTPVGTVAITRLPVLIGHPSDVMVAAGTEFSFGVEAVASSVVEYEWHRDGNVLAGATNATIQITNAQAQHQGVYRAEVRTAFGSLTSSNATVTVASAAPTVLNIPNRIEIIEGTPTNLFVQVRGSEPMQFQWMKDGVEIAGASNATYHLESPRAADSGRYSALIENKAGDVITGWMDVTVFEWPRITSGETNLNLLAGADHTLTASTTGTTPLSHFWQFTGPARLIPSSNSVTLRNVQAADAGDLYLVVTNRYGAVTGLVARVSVTDRAPVILVQPQDRSFVAGGNGSINVQAVGTEPLSFQWFKDGVAVAGATNSGIAFNDYTSEDEGSYHVIVSNRLGAVTSASAGIGSNVVEQFDWPSLALEPIATNDFSLTQLTHAHDGSGRLFVLEQRGFVRILEDGKFKNPAFLNITNRVLAGGEFGLLGIAFPSDYAQSGVFYTAYSRRGDRATVLSRFRVTADPDIADAESEQVLLTIGQPTDRHHGGQIAFGPDGYLYFGTGDGGVSMNAYVAQNPTNLLGKILRLDVSGSSTNYTVPASNPFVGKAGYRPEIWALGLRNPWRFSFDRVTGDLYIADVGERTYEEVNFQAAGSAGGENYGWPIFEGPRQQLPLTPNSLADFTAPVAALERNESAAIIGGVVHRGPAGDRSYGVYLSADYANGRIWGLRRSGAGWTNVLLGRIGSTISSFGEDEAGNVYVTQVAGASGSRVFRVYDSRRALAPSFGRVNPSYVTAQEVTLSSATPGAMIHYTFDGSEPTRLSPSVRSGETVTVSSNLTLKARAMRDGLGESEVTSAKYNLVVHLTFAPTGSVTNGTPITINSTAPNSKIWYTLDGTEPTTNSAIYSGPIILQGGQWVRAAAIAEGWTPSRLYQQFFGLLDWEPVVIQRVAGSGTAGANDGPGITASFNSPLAIAVARDGNLYVVDSGNKSIRKISPGREVSTFAADFLDPVGICVDPAGNVYVSDRGADQIFKITPDGRKSVYAGSGGDGYDDGPALQATFQHLGHVEMDVEGTIYVTDWLNVRKITTAGEVAWLRPGGGGRSGLGLRNNRELFAISDDGAIWRFGPTAETSGYYAGVAGRNAHSDGVGHNIMFYTVARDMAGDDKGNLFVPDYAFVRRIDESGRSTTLLERPMFPDPNWMKLISGITVDDRGNIFVSDLGDHSVKRISPDTDRDGVPDPDESAPFVVGIDDRLVDSDGDGLSNAAEYSAGTDAGSSAGVRITAEQNDGEMVITWSATPGKVYRLERSEDLVNWAEFSTGGGSVQSPIRVERSGLRGFFRIQSQ